MPGPDYRRTSCHRPSAGWPTHFAMLAASRSQGRFHEPALMHDERKKTARNNHVGSMPAMHGASAVRTRA